ncbi:MAG: hypothetical protein IJ316_02560 [Clostridia bacterium]|nr:hypothetical protein [Clostridia bacterium]
MNFIDMLYYGDIAPRETPIPPTEEYLRYTQAITKCEKKLYELLSDESLSLFQTFSTLSDNINYTLNKENFRMGFRLGAQMMMDVLKSDNE